MSESEIMSPGEAIVYMEKGGFVTPTQLHAEKNEQSGRISYYGIDNNEVKRFYATRSEDVHISGPHKVVNFFEEFLSGTYKPYTVYYAVRRDLTAKEALRLLLDDNNLVLHCSIGQYRLSPEEENGFEYRKTTKDKFRRATIRMSAFLLREDWYIKTTYTSSAYSCTYYKATRIGY